MFDSSFSKRHIFIPARYRLASSLRIAWDTRHAGFHQLLCAVHAGSASGKPGTAAFHRAGEQSLGPRSDQLSRTSPREGRHSPRREPCAVKEVGEQEQTRWYAQDQDEADAPTPGGHSRSTEPQFARLPVPRLSGCTSDPGRFPDPRQRGAARRPHDADTIQQHQKQ